MRRRFEAPILVRVCLCVQGDPFGAHPGLTSLNSKSYSLSNIKLLPDI